MTTFAPRIGARDRFVASRLLLPALLSLIAFPSPSQAGEDERLDTIDSVNPVDASALSSTQQFVISSVNFQTNPSVF